MVAKPGQKDGHFLGVLGSAYESDGSVGIKSPLGLTLRPFSLTDTGSI